MLNQMKAYYRVHRHFFDAVLAIGVPIAVQNLLTTSVGIVDTFMVSSLGESSLAAVGLCNQFGSLYFSCYWGFICAGTLFFAQYWGAKNEDGICSAYGIVLCFIGIVALVFTVLGLAVPEFILSVYTDNPEIRAIGASYLRIIALSYPAAVMSMALSCLMRSTENVRVPLVGSIASMITNTFLNWVLIFGNLGAPAMGARGAAIASVIAVHVNLAALYALSVNDPRALVLRIRRHFHWPRGLLAEFLRKAAPMILNEILYGIGQMLINIVLGHQSASGIAAMALFRVIEGLVFSFFIGLVNASSVLVGKQVGAGELRGAYKDAVRLAWMCPLVTFCVCILIWPLSPLVLNLFSMGLESSGYVFWMVGIYCIAGPLRTCNYILNNTFRAGGEPVIGAVFEIGALFLISVPLTWTAGMILYLPYLVIVASMYIEELIKLGIGLGYLKSGRWIKPVTQEGEAELPIFLAWLKTLRASS